MKNYSLTVNPENAHVRLDAFIASQIDDISRSIVQKLISSEQIFVNGNAERANYRVQPGDHVMVNVPPAQETDIVAENIPLTAVFEDDQIIVIDKPCGMVVHPAPGNISGTLVNAILAHTDDLSGVGGVERPGIVHRLDKDTSGLLVVAKTDVAHQSLQTQIQERSAQRRYIALVWGDTKFNDAVVDAPIGRHPTDRKKMSVIKDTGRYTAREALTNLTVLERIAGFTLLEAKLDTGRTHQIRVHCSFIGHPVVGDPMYGGAKRNLPGGFGKIDQIEISRLIDALPGQALHAYSLAFTHPTTGEELSFKSEIRADMAALINYLRGISNSARR